METTKNGQKGFIGNSKFGKHFYALVMGLVIVLSGGFYFLVSAAGDLNVESSLANAVQTIKQVIVTSDGTSAGTKYFDFNSDGDGGAIFNNVKNGTIAGYLGLDNSNKLIYTNSLGNDDHDWVREANGDVYTTGNVSIGASYYEGPFNVISNVASTPEAYLEQKSNSAVNMWLKNNSSSMWSLGVYASGLNEYFYIGSTGTAFFRIYPDGVTSIDGDLYLLNHNITNVNDITAGNFVTAVAFVMSSDKSLKENIKTITNPLDKIYALNGYTFDWKKDGRHDIGLIAQEVEKVLPELVHTNSNGIKGVEYANMVALLIEGVKEMGNKIGGLYNKYLDQQKKIDDLELRINALELKNQ